MDVMGVQVPLRVRLDVMSKQSQLIWGVQISHLVNAARRKKKTLPSLESCEVEYKYSLEVK